MKENTTSPSLVSENHYEIAASARVWKRKKGRKIIKIKIKTKKRKYIQQAIKKNWYIND